MPLDLTEFNSGADQTNKRLYHELRVSKNLQGCRAGQVGVYQSMGQNLLRTMAWALF